MKEFFIFLLLIGAVIVIYKLVISRYLLSFSHRQLERKLGTMSDSGNWVSMDEVQISWEQAKQILIDADLGNNHLKKEVRPTYCERYGHLDSWPPVTWTDKYGYYQFIVIFSHGRSGITQPYKVHSVTRKYSKT